MKFNVELQLISVKRYVFVDYVDYYHSNFLLHFVKVKAEIKF